MKKQTEGTKRVNFYLVTVLNVTYKVDVLRTGATLEKIFRSDEMIIAKSMNDSSKNDYVRILNSKNRRKIVRLPHESFRSHTKKYPSFLSNHHSRILQ